MLIAKHQALLIAKHQALFIAKHQALLIAKHQALLIAKHQALLMAKSALKIRARELRSQGESVKVIAHKLKVSTSTASLWCRNIELSTSQLKELERRAHDPTYGKRLQNSLKQKNLRIEKTEKLIKQGISEIGRLKKRELFLCGVALYWSEGFKSDNLAGFCNLDTSMIQFFICWLKKCFNYKNSDIKLRVGLNENYRNKTEEIEKFWVKLTKIPKSQFQKPFYQMVKWKKQYDHPENYHGVLRIRIKKSTDFLRLIKGYIEGLRLNSA